jgi:hypothetical protein
MKSVANSVLACLLLSLAAGACNAQQVTAILRGAVYDPSGATVSSVTISATQIETGFSRTATSDSQGDFILVELPVGHYKLQADAKGFQHFDREGLILEVNQTAFVAIHLVIGTATRTIEIVGDVPLVEPTTSSLGKTVDQQTIQDLPLNGRHFTQLGTLQTGVVPITPGLQAAGGSLRNGQEFSFWREQDPAVPGRTLQHF